MSYKIIITRTIKEFSRHVIYRANLYSVLTNLRSRQNRGNTAHLAAVGIKERFSSIYELKVWGDDRENDPLSGLGSSLKVTSALRESLTNFLNGLDAQTLLDVGCGDFTWMQYIDFDGKYIGIDIVESVINKNIASYSNKNREFYVIDATSSHLPKADIVICREVLFHLSFKDASKVLKEIFNTGCKYIILTSDKQTLFNSDIPSGDFRVLNLAVRPFNFPSPDVAITDSGFTPLRSLNVWRSERLSPFIDRLR